MHPLLYIAFLHPLFISFGVHSQKIVNSSVQFFMTKPFPCDPASLPKYPPSKEFDVKLREEEARRYTLLCMYHNSSKYTCQV